MIHLLLSLCLASLAYSVNARTFTFLWSPCSAVCTLPNKLAAYNVRGLRDMTEAQLVLDPSKLKTHQCAIVRQNFPSLTARADVCANRKCSRGSDADRLAERDRSSRRTCTTT
ncbi:uncharacterized protein L969DRAFT_87650 [Mixia osmundae IAM 14324]|uniref:uncharacterized protein n=1 Tax=Mixia osmundae (strain CBS 9802 / IAM 14324 / JCM 22182 / KY 12970) TaxID=764103 RepID=UPI0004A54982|nr:uncharacterized protein L969DRAFT_87650 [Mixia osmundae IAM 14324]KEI39671.1 hypothetical protein L969DRAFT_87650 [Mixia osmundae IAM 14324]